MADRAALPRLRWLGSFQPGGAWSGARGLSAASAEEHPGLLVMVDSHHAYCRTLGISENDAEMAEFGIGSCVEVLQPSGEWLNGWMLADLVTTTKGMRCRIENGSNSLNVSVDQIRCCGEPT